MGRSQAQAYAYLLVPDEAALTSEAQKRLKALMEFTELGSGYRLATRDLQIRGAGNILGHSQSGQIESVGMDMYLDLLSQAIAEGARSVSGTEVLITAGATEAIAASLLALLEPGDEVIYPNPGFPIYESMIRFLDAVPVPIPLVEDRGFSFDLNVLRARLSDRTRLIILNSPQNPTGGVLTRQDIRDIARAIGDRNIIVLSDEIYSRIVYDGRYVSMMSYPGMAERTVILDGFSKSFAMTGWRLGYAVAPPHITPALTMMVANSYTSVAEFEQYAAITALREAEKTG